MVTPGPSSLRVILCVALVASTALAGCADKDPDDGPTPNPFASPDDATTFGDYARYFQGDETGDCDGCIRLEPADRDGPQKHLVPVPEPGVTVPLPAIGDHIEVMGERRAATGPELGGVPFPTDEEGQYHFDLVFEALGSTAPAMVQQDRPLARFEATYAFGAYPVDDAAFQPSHASLFVDLDTRAVAATSASGRSAAHPEALIGAYSNQDLADATHHATPGAANLFWLGAHLWGHTWFQGDTFTATWSPPDTDAPALWYDYRVTKAETVAPPDPTPSDPRHAGPGNASYAEPRPTPTLVVRVDVHDHFGKERRWELRFHADSPYPSAVRLTRDVHASVERSLIPPEIVWQSIDVVRRGASPVPWPAVVQETHPEPRTWDDRTFRIDERLASPALDALPVYPLSAAIQDLGNLDPSFRDWWRNAPRAVLADAHLEPALFYSGVASALEYAWTLTFLDGGTTHAWTVSRLATGPDTVAPVAHRAEAAKSAELSASLRLMDPAEHAQTRLAAGDGLAPALVDIGVTGRVDRAHYALTHTPEEGLGGRLLVGAARLPDTPEAFSDGGNAGHAVQDLATAAVVDALVFDP